MEVKIQYVTDLDNIPEECVELTPSTVQVAESISNLKENFIRRDMEHALLDLQTIKKKLYHINRRILDLEGIVAGYIQVKNTPAQDEAQEYHLEDNTELFEGIEESEETTMEEE